MPKNNKQWSFYPVHSDLQQVFAERWGVHPWVAQLMINRGVWDNGTMRQFLAADASGLHDAFQLKDVEPAVERISAAIHRKEHVTVFGDYDADGVTSVVVMLQTLRALGANADYYIPDRQTEGYGMNRNAVDKLAAQGTQLLITVDCGIGSVDEVHRAREQGIDVIVTDHHQPPDQLPSALAVINPHQPGCTYPEKNLAGVGVAFKLCQACCQKSGGSVLQDELMHLLDLVAVGTIADIVPLTGENRTLVKLGLARLRQGTNMGLKAISAVCSQQGEISSTDVAFRIAPRINAIGRMAKAQTAVELFLTQDQAEAERLAQVLEQANAERKRVENEIYTAALTMLAAGDENDPVLVLAGTGWHTGVIGIVASRLVERYYRPTILLNLKDGLAKGSCRSIPGFNIYQALAYCRKDLLQFGGHAQAAGLTLYADQVAAFRTHLNDYAAEVLTAADFVPKLQLDAAVEPEGIDNAFVTQLACLEPYGEGNGSPVFGCLNVPVTNIRPIGKEKKHLHFQIRTCRGRRIDAVAWNMGECAAALQDGERLDVAFTPELHAWQGRTSVQFVIRDFHPATACPQPAAMPPHALPALTGVSQVIFRPMPEEGKTFHNSLTQVIQALDKGENIFLLSPTDRLPWTVYLSRVLQAHDQGRRETTLVVLPLPSLLRQRFFQLRRFASSQGIQLRIWGKQDSGENGSVCELVLTTPDFFYTYPKETFTTLVGENVDLWSEQEQRQLLDCLGNTTRFPVLLTTACASLPQEWDKVENHFCKVVDQTYRDKLVLHDARRESDKTAYLAALVSRGESTLVYTRNAAAAVALTQKLDGLFSGQGRAAFCHALLPPTAAEATEDAFYQGNLQVLVVPENYTPPPGECGTHLVLFDPPTSLASFRRLLDVCDAKGSNLHLLFTCDDISFTRDLFLQLVPDRATVALIYLILKQTCLINETVDGTDRQIARAVYRRYGKFLSEATVEAAVCALEDLAILRRKTQNGKRSIRMLPVPKKKMMLESSTTLRKNTQKVQALTLLETRIMSLSERQLSRFITGREEYEVELHGF